MLVYAVTIFLSAFLLFQVQPLIAKFILPWFGGSAAVWSAALLFFQLLLLAGYLYAHCLIRYLKPRQQFMIHMPLLALASLTLPIIPSDAWKPEPSGQPTFQILGLLAVTIGLPYMILSSTSPLLQAWYVRKNRGAIPYKLFALSNFGSMLALLSYPFLVEPNIALRNQAYIWSGGFGLFAVACVLTAWASRESGESEGTGLEPPVVRAASAGMAGEPGPDAEPRAASEPVSTTVSVEVTEPPRLTTMLYWIALAACASALLLATTSHLTQNVAPIPLLWVAPLSLYLLSFILSFESDRIYQRWFFLPLGLVALGVYTRGITAYENNEDVIHWLIPILCIALFIACMVCHGELAKRKPHPRYLTLFFLMVSIGGAVGGLFVALLAPAIFPNYWEMPISVVALALLMALAVWNDAEEIGKWLVQGIFAAITVALLVTAYYTTGSGRLIYAAAALAPLILLVLARKVEAGTGATRAFLLILVAAFGTYLARVEYYIDSDYELTTRDFYGVLRVSESPPDGVFPGERVLIHGTINHGTELLMDGGDRTPSSYFGYTSGINRAIRAKGESGPIRLGIIGLGAGVTATLAREGDTLHYYEINPQVFDVATHWFDFWEACPADKQIQFGDGRLTMERLPDENLDVLVMDAFTSDAVPVHMLTKEAFDVFLRHLNPGGLIMVNVTNRYLDLAPVVAAAAEEIGFTAMLVYDEGISEPYLQPTSWVIVSEMPEFFNHPNFSDADITLLKPREGFRGWTDDYSNIFDILY